MTEIAKRLGVSRTSVSKRLHRALAKLHTYLKYAAELYFGREM
jgi:DNA-directed RNA polymerase specialized sigma24 family protein